jgi:hypothetical protein
MHAIDASGTKILSFRRLGRNYAEVVAASPSPHAKVLGVIVIAPPLLVPFFTAPGGS